MVALHQQHVSVAIHQAVSAPRVKTADQIVLHQQLPSQQLPAQRASFLL
jgi:hypothetical protein